MKQIVACPGPEVIAYRKTYWEQWAILELAAVIAQIEGIQPWIAPFLQPYMRLEGTVLHHPQSGSLTLSEQDAALLRECGGRDTAKQIAARLLRAPGRLFESEDEIYAGLRALTDRDFLFWAFNIPQCAYPERVLRAALERIEDPDIRGSALELLDGFEAAKDRVETSTGDAERLNLAYRDLEQIFTRITGRAPARHEGKAYAGRTLVYQDCCRDVQVLLGTELLSALGGPLSLFLTSARWFTARLADVYKKKLLALFSEFVQQTGNSSVEAVPFLGRVASILFQHGPDTINPVQAELHEKWERILQFESDTGPVRYSSEELRHKVLREFPATAPGWALARHHSPDIMIAADGEESIRRGDYFFVMGELHASINSLTAGLWINQHPSPADLMEAMERDLGPVGMFPYWTNAKNLGSRTAPSLIPESCYRLECASTSFVIDRSKTLPLSSMIVEKHDEELWARTRDNTFRMKLIDLLGPLISPGTADCFRGLSQRRHTPRIWIDRMVVKRESWRFSASEMQFALCSDPAGRFLQARIWAAEQGLPRFVFTSLPTELKPFYVDLESPVLVDIFSKMIRSTLAKASPGAIVSISEMLPTADQAWLADAENRRYTSEIRFVAVDSSEPWNAMRQSAAAEIAAV